MGEGRNVRRTSVKGSDCGAGAIKLGDTVEKGDHAYSRANELGDRNEETGSMIGAPELIFDENSPRGLQGSERLHRGSKFG